ncbi:Mn-dependent DtxR family transcriptional regulator [Clostridium pascui]|uniref:metal-dependent transcriptional regulator n=1 Tax=Clostridium pascui TaxID=46609 RepID=UPI00195DCB81|nr:iron dependent repressor, metal binding and dimerization domain protein [Clostridium pascui]MBM7868818.1 Mn-dependent DtxR family transcriptional regulator [Clostridium pascui]
MSGEDFYTFRGYMEKDWGYITASMEDYIEMIYRLSLCQGFTRVNELSKALNVQPPSATKMLHKLSELNLVIYEKYGVVILTEEGKQMGGLLLTRHNIIESFLKLISPKGDVLEQTEKIEHSLTPETIKNLNYFLDFLNKNPDIANKYNKYLMDKDM